MESVASSVSIRLADESVESRRLRTNVPPPRAAESETPFSVNTTAGFGCDRQVRGNASASFEGRMGVLNHFLTDLLGAPYLAAQANPASVVNRHFYGCQGQWGSLPQFLAVDFYTISDTLSQADSLNRLARGRA